MTNFEKIGHKTLEILNNRKTTFSRKSTIYKELKSKHFFCLGKVFFFKTILQNLEDQGYITGWHVWITITKRGKAFLAENNCSEN